MQVTPIMYSTSLLPSLSSQVGGQEKSVDPISIIIRLQNVVYGIYRQHTNKCQAVEIGQLTQASQLVKDSLQIVDGLTDKLTSITAVKDKNHYVHVHQVAMTRLLDKVVELLQHCQLSKQEEELLWAVKNNLQSVFFAFEELFGGYFDRSEMVPGIFADAKLQELQVFNEKLLPLMEKSEAIDSDLASVLKERISHYIPSAQLGVSYGVLNAYLNFISELNGDLKNLTATQVRRLLYKVNLFEEEWVNYEVGRLYVLENGAETVKQKIAVLRYEQKLINQWPACNWLRRSDNEETLGERVNRWIDEEVKFLEAGHSTMIGGQSRPDVGEKIHTSLSVAKLAVIIRLLVVDKIIINRTVAPMLRIVARLFTTLQRDEISFVSLESKYHAPDKATVSAVRDMLFKWIKILDKL